MNRYQPLIQFIAQHEYFGFKSFPIAVRPAAETLKVLKQCEWLYLETENGFNVLQSVPADKTTSGRSDPIDKLHATLASDPDPDAVLEFRIDTQDIQFFQYTENLNSDLSENPVTLSISSNKDIPGKFYSYIRSIGSTVPEKSEGSNTPVFQYQKCMESNVSRTADKWENSIEARQAPLFIVRVPLQSLAEELSDGISIIARIISRKVLWRYNLFSSDLVDKDVEILDRDNLVTFNKLDPYNESSVDKIGNTHLANNSAQQFISSTRIPLTNRAEYRFELHGCLKQGGQKINLEQRLPQASAGNLSVASDEASEYISDIYVNL